MAALHMIPFSSTDSDTSSALLNLLSCVQTLVLTLPNESKAFSKPSLNLAHEVAEALKTTIDDLFIFEDQEAR